MEKEVPQSASVTSLTFLVETPLDVHLHQGQTQRLLVSLVAGEQASREGPLPVLWDEQIQGAHPRPQSPRLVAVAMTLAPRGAFVRGGAYVLGHLGLQDLL